MNTAFIVQNAELPITDAAFIQRKNVSNLSATTRLLCFFASDRIELALPCDAKGLSQCSCTANAPLKEQNYTR
jgi:hypothetical protein